MSARFPIKCLFSFAALVLTTPAPLAQERLVINVGKAKRPTSSSSAIHYQGTGSVRHSEQRTYEGAQARHGVQAAENRSEVQTRQGTAGAQIVCRRRFEAAMVVIRSEAAKRSSYALPAGKEPRKRRALRSSGVYVKLKTEHRKPNTGLALRAGV